MACQDLGSAMSGVVKCAATPATRRWVRADQVDSSRAALGKQVQAQIGGVPVQDSKGRYAHVAGIYLSAYLRITHDENVAVTAHELRSIWQNIQLQDVSGHMYFPGTLDGRDLADDAFFRHWADQQWPFMTAGVQAGLPVTKPSSPTKTADYGLAADIEPGATTDFQCSLYIPLQTKGKGSQLEGLIPLAALQRAGAGALQFNIGPALLIPAQTGITLVNLINDAGQVGFDIWLDLVYLDEIVVDAPWQLRSYTKTETSLVLDNADRVTEYLFIRFHENDAPEGGQSSGLNAAGNIGGGVSLQAAGFTELSGFTVQNMLQRGMLHYASEPSGALARANAKQDLPMLNASGGMQAVALYPYRQRAFAPAGPISLDMPSRSGAFTRFLHRTVGCQTKARIESILQSASCNPCACAVFGTNAQGSLAQTVTSSAPVVVKPA